MRDLPGRGRSRGPLVMACSRWEVCGLVPSKLSDEAGDGGGGGGAARVLHSFHQPITL